MTKKVMYVIGAIFLILIITNPSLKDFKDHSGRTTYEGLYREHNFFVCSMYGATGKNDDGSIYNAGEYFAMLGNFFEID